MFGFLETFLHEMLLKKADIYVSRSRAQIRGLYCKTEGSLFWEERKAVFCTQYEESFHFILQRLQENWFRNKEGMGPKSLSMYSGDLRLLRKSNPQSIYSRQHQREGLYSVFQTFAETHFFT